MTADLIADLTAVEVVTGTLTTVRNKRRAKCWGYSCRVSLGPGEGYRITCGRKVRYLCESCARSTIAGAQESITGDRGFYLSPFSLNYVPAIFRAPQFTLKEVLNTLGL